jgi:rSAM/selenodomain-associated transferase 2
VRLSIIIPAWNEAAGIHLAVRRALELEPLEVIVADAGCPDGTGALASDAGAIVVNGARGRGAQLNAGAAVARGDCLLFLHADNWLEPPAGRQLAEAWSAGARAAAFRQQIDARDRVFRWIERGNAWRAARFGLAYGDQAIFLDRTLFEGLGGFHEAPLMEDVDLMLRLRGQTRLTLLPGPLHVSARRWERRGAVRQTLSNWSILAAYFFGVSPARLARWYAASPPALSSDRHG